MRFTGAQDQKVFLMLESGVRFHVTKFSRDKNDVPSVFCMKVVHISGLWLLFADSLYVVAQAHPHETTGGRAPAGYGSRSRIHIWCGECAMSLDYGALCCGTSNSDIRYWTCSWLVHLFQQGKSDSNRRELQDLDTTTHVQIRRRQCEHFSGTDLPRATVQTARTSECWARQRDVSHWCWQGHQRELEQDIL